MWRRSRKLPPFSIDCPEVHSYWHQVLRALELMTLTHIPKTPLTALLGYTKQVPANRRKFVSFTLVLAKRRVACCWGRGRAPKFKNWITDMIFWQDQLNKYAELLPISSRPRDIWGPLQKYLLEHPIDSSWGSTRKDGDPLMFHTHHTSRVLYNKGKTCGWHEKVKIYNLPSLAATIHCIFHILHLWYTDKYSKVLQNLAHTSQRIAYFFCSFFVFVC